jgi:hypothetical protein
MFENKSLKRVLSIIVVIAIVISSVVIGLYLQSTPSSFVVQTISDGFNGAIMAWWSKNDDGHDGTLYMQRVNSEGQTLWNDIGVFIADDSSTMFSLSPDGLGGAIVTWSKTNSHLYSQHISAEGKLHWYPSIEHPLAGEYWTFNDGSQGIAILWRESNFIYAQHLDEIFMSWENLVKGGEIENDCGLLSIIPPDSTSNEVRLFFRTWDSNGHSIYSCTDIYGRVLWEKEYSSNDYIPKMISDGNDGLLFARNQIFTQGQGKWETITGCRVYVEKLSPVEEAIWGEKPIIETGSGKYPKLDIVSDGNGGVFITWRLENEDKRQALGKIFIQKVDIQGNTSWNNDGIPVFPDARLRYQGVPSIVDADSGTAIVVAAVGKSPVQGDMIYAQKFDMYGNRLWGTCIRIDL